MFLSLLKLQESSKFRRGILLQWDFHAQRLHRTLPRPFLFVVFNVPSVNWIGWWRAMSWTPALPGSPRFPHLHIGPASSWLSWTRFLMGRSVGDVRVTAILFSDWCIEDNLYLCHSRTEFLTSSICWWKTPIFKGKSARDIVMYAPLRSSSESSRSGTGTTMSGFRRC